VSLRLRPVRLDRSGPFHDKVRLEPLDKSTRQLARDRDPNLPFDLLNKCFGRTQRGMDQDRGALVGAPAAVLDRLGVPIRCAQGWRTLSMAQSLSAVDGAFFAGPMFSVQRISRMVARTRSSSVGVGSRPAGGVADRQQRPGDRRRSQAANVQRAGQ
jgi:hypothetical protein